MVSSCPFASSFYSEYSQLVGLNESLVYSLFFARNVIVGSSLRKKKMKTKTQNKNKHLTSFNLTVYVSRASIILRSCYDACCKLYVHQVTRAPPSNIATNRLQSVFRGVRLLDVDSLLSVLSIFFFFGIFPDFTLMTSRGKKETFPLRLRLPSVCNLDANHVC